MSYLELLKLAALEVIVALTALVVLAIDLASLRSLETRLRFTIGGMITCVGCVAAILWMLVMPEQAHASGGMLVVTPLTQHGESLPPGADGFHGVISVESKFTDHVGEYLVFSALSPRDTIVKSSSCPVIGRGKHVCNETGASRGSMTEA